MIFYFLLAGCSNDPGVAGGVSEETNARVSCKVQYANGQPAMGAKVYIRPSDFCADTGFTSAYSPVADALTDNTGIFELDSLVPGNYRIEIIDTTTITRKQAALIDVSIYDGHTDVELPIVLLMPTGSLAGKIDRSLLDTTTVYVQVIGLEKIALVKSNGDFVVADLPSQKNLALRFISSAYGMRAFDTLDVEVLPDKQDSLGLLQLSANYFHDSLIVRAVLDSLGLTTVPVCSISSVNASLHRIRFLDLSSRGINTIPDIITSLSALDSFNCSGNLLTDVPVHLSRLTSLDYLNMGSNSLMHIPQEIMACTSLVFFDVSSNAIDSISSGIGNLSQLKILYLQSNNIVTLPAEIFLLPHLERLSVAVNHIAVLPDEVGQCVSLVNISLSVNDLTKLPVSICNLVLTSEIHLNDNLLDSLPENFGNLRKLLTLELQNNQLTMLPQSISQMRYLSHLNVTANKMCGVQPSGVDAFIEARQPLWRSSQVCP